MEGNAPTVGLDHCRREANQWVTEEGHSRSEVKGIARSGTSSENETISTLNASNILK